MNFISYDYNVFLIYIIHQTGEDYDAEEEDSGINKSDSELMPPPPLPRTSEAGTTTPPSDRRRPVTPLAAMLPSKYANIDVRELFPDFRTDAVSVVFSYEDKCYCRHNILL